jgi:hypothetical protein
LFPVLQALPNQGTVDYPSFKLVIVGDGGTGEFPGPALGGLCICFGMARRDLFDAPPLRGLRRDLIGRGPV